MTNSQGVLLDDGNFNVIVRCRQIELLIAAGPQVEEAFAEMDRSVRVKTPRLPTLRTRKIQIGPLDVT